MRYIDTSHIAVPANWVTLARQARKLNRQRKFSEGALWSYFKEDFQDIVGKKCWYSESSNIGTNNPIDHFRPKANGVVETPLFSNISSLASQLDLTQGTGYPFLEFEFSNYRYACGIVNSLKDGTDGVSRGKSNRFPIQAGSPRATSLNQTPNEIHCLLDPCVQSDVDMLTFTENGLIEAHISILNNSWEYCRVKVSIEVYHLKYFFFVERRKEVWGFCTERIDIIAKCMQKRLRNEQLSEIENQSMIQARKDLNKNIDRTAEFSAVAIDCLRHYQRIYPWLSRIISNLRK